MGGTFYGSGKRGRSLSVGGRGLDRQDLQVSRWVDNLKVSRNSNGGPPSLYPDDSEETDMLSSFDEPECPGRFLCSEVQCV